MNPIKHISSVMAIAAALFCGLLCASEKKSSNTTVHPEYDDTSLIRNPVMGWGLYDDANDEVQQADAYWKAQDKAARNYASFFYVRWRWSDMEPEEGKYAWVYNENYKKLIKGAIDRGLKLCFRIYDNGQDNIRPGTPGFVQKAGAKGYLVHSGPAAHWTPYPDDPVFQEKWSNFVKAFAREYDDPDRVDFIDGFALGWWGECHHIQLQEPANLEKVFNWYTSLYTSNFKRILLTLPFGSQVGFDAEKRIAIDKKGYNMRRDGLGSMWFSDKEKAIANEMFGKALLVGESCYWQCSTDDCRPFANDEKYKLNSWNDVYELTYRQAIKYHFNTLDLREIPETKGWTERAPYLVKGFITKGGYRVYPPIVTLPQTVHAGEKIVIQHYWVNKGTGYLPNNNIKWNYKYKPAIAILDTNGRVLNIWVDEKAEPSCWTETGKSYTYGLPVQIPQLPAGKYKWAIAIVDRTRSNSPGIKLAVKNGKLQNGWNVIADLYLTD